MVDLSLTVFVSSRGELSEERRAVVAAIKDSGHNADPFEAWPALSRSPLEASIAAAERADIVVLLLGSTYGPLAPAGRSITHEEYRAARAKGIPVLAFQVSTKDPEPRQSEFISEVRDRETIRPVASIDDLKQDVLQAIRAEVVQRFRAPQRETAIVSTMSETGLTAERRLSITVDVQAEVIASLRGALTRQVGAKLNDARAVFRMGHTNEAVAILEDVRVEPEWDRVDVELRARVLTTLATFHRATGSISGAFERLVEEAREIDPRADYSYFEALHRYDTHGAEEVLDLLSNVENTRALNLKLALLLDLGRIEAAVGLLDQMPKTIEPDVETERLRAFIEMAKGNAEAAIAILDSALKKEPHSESLRLATAIMNIASTIIPDERPLYPSPWLPPIDPAFIVTTPEMLSRLEKAAAMFDEVIRNTQRKGDALEQMRAWQLAAAALHPKRRDDARAMAAEMLAADAGNPAAIVWSIAFGFDVDAKRAAEALAAAAHETLTSTRIVAAIAAVEHRGDLARAEAILDEHRAIFSGEEDLWRFWKARLMARSGRFDDAVALVEQIGAAELRDAAELIASESRAKATDEWDAFLALADHLDPGYGALVVRARLGRWDEIVEKASTLVKQTPSPATVKLAATALFRVRRYAESLAILRKHEELWSQSTNASDLHRLTVQNQIVIGELIDALKGAERLFGATKAVHDLMLTIHAAISAGRRKDARFWASRLLEIQGSDLRQEDLLQIARTIATEDRALARRLWKRAEIAGFENRLVPAAMSLAMTLGLNDEAQKLAEAALASGLLRQASVDDVIAAQNARAEALADPLRAYSEGEMPLALLLAATQRTLAEVYEIQLSFGRRSAVDSTPPLYIRHGGRMRSARLSLKKIRALTLDISTILLADMFGVLDAIEARFETLRISAVTCAALAEQQDRLQPVQPAMDVMFAEILRLFEEKLFSELASGTAAQAAVENGGHLVTELDDISKAPAEAKLYLTSSSAFELTHRKELEHLANERVVFVEAETISVARTRIEERRQRDAVVARLAKLAERIGAGLESGKYHVFKTTAPDRADPELDLTVHALTDFFRAAGQRRHAFVVDDRFASSQLALAASPVVTLMNVLAELRASKHLPDNDYFQILLQLRRANCRFIDLDADEIVHWLAKAAVTGAHLEESEPLRILRVYLNGALSDRNLRVIPLPQTNPNGCAFGEGAFAMNSSFATSEALVKIWSVSEWPGERRTAMADWILRSLYTGTYGVHHLYGEGFNASRMLMSADVGGLLTSFYDFDLSRAEAFTGWAQSRIVQHRLDSDPDLFSDVLKMIKQQLSKAAADSPPIGKRAARAMFAVLPPRMRVAIAEDHAFAQAIDLRGRRFCGVGGFEFSEDDFFAAIEELRTKSEVVLTAMTGESVRVSCAAGDEGLFFDGGTERRLFPNDTFVTLAFKTDEEQRECLLAHPEIFDVADEALPSEVDKLLALPTWRERVERQRDLATSSAASHYANLRQPFANPTFSDLLPPSDALLRHYLPGYVKGVRLDAAAAFAPLVDRADLLDVLRRAIAMPVPLPETLSSRLIAQPEPRRDEILASLREEAASPVARAHLAILGFVSGTQTGRSLAFEVIGEMAGTALAARQAKLFMTVLRFVYWRLSRDPGLETDVRLLLAWAHTARLVGIFLATGSDMGETQKSFTEIGEIFPDDFWTRSPSSLDVLYPHTATGGRTITAAIAHVAASVQSEDDASEAARKLAALIYPKTVTIPAPLLRDLSLGTNITESFLTADLSEPLTAVNAEGAAILSPAAKPELLAKAMRSIDEKENAAVGWTLIDAIIGNLPPPPDVRAWIQQLVLGPALEAILGSEDSIAAFSVLANLQPHFGDDYRQRVEDLAVSAITQSQAKKLEPDEFAMEANRWMIIGVALAARPESREQTGAALGRILRRFIDAAPAITPFAATVLTILPFQLPMEYLPALWPAVIAARATPRFAIS